MAEERFGFRISADVSATRAGVRGLTKDLKEMQKATGMRPGQKQTAQRASQDLVKNIRAAGREQKKLTMEAKAYAAEMGKIQRGWQTPSGGGGSIVSRPPGGGAGQAAGGGTPRAPSGFWGGVGAGALGITPGWEFQRYRAGRFVGGLGRRVLRRGAGALIGMAIQGIDIFREFGQEAALFASATGNQSRKVKWGTGLRYGYTAPQVYRMAAPMAQQVGDISGLGHMMAVQRGFGVDPGQYTGYQAAMLRGTGVVNPKGFWRMSRRAALAGGYATRGRPGRQGLAMQTMMAAMGMAQTGMPEVNARNIAGMIGVLGGRGGVAFQGQRLMGIMGGFQGAMRGGDEAREAFGLRAMGLGRGVSYYEAKKRLEQGIWAPGNMSRLMKQATREYGTGKYANIALGAYGNISLSMVERLRSIGADNLTPDAIRDAMGRTSYEKPGQMIGKYGKLGVARMDAALTTQKAGYGAALYGPYRRIQLAGLRGGKEVLGPVADAADALATAVKKTVETIKVLRVGFTWLFDELFGSTKGWDFSMGGGGGDDDGPNASYPPSYGGKHK